MQKYELNEVETDMVAEYMAGVILANNGRYIGNLLPQDEVMKETDSVKVVNKTEETKTEEKTNTIKSLTSSKKEDNSTLNEVLNLKKLNISYKGYSIHKEYPEDKSNEYFSLPAREGYQLLVAKFDVVNNTTKNQKLNLKSNDILYQLDVNVGTVYKPLFTLLENDLRYIDINVKAEEIKEAILVFEIKKEKEIKDINLLISRGTKSEIIELK